MNKIAFQFETKVSAGGQLEVTVPLAAGTLVEVLVLAPESDGFDDLAQAALSSTDFWDNPWDDEDWNNA